DRGRQRDASLRHRALKRRRAAGARSARRAGGARAGRAEVKSMESLELRGATLIDGTGAPPLTEATVRIKDGRIAAVWRGVAPAPTTPADRVLDVGGKTVLPGLID